MKYKLIIFGCQFNKSDAERVASVIAKAGFKPAQKEFEADLIIVLACSVRQSAIDRIYGLKKKWEEIRTRKPLITVLSGCVLEKDKTKMAEFFDFILPINDLQKLPEKLSNLPTYKLTNFLDVHPSYNSEFQAYVPIMTGCNNFCTYCVVPYVRGREVSRPAEKIIEECQELISKGYKEIILLGQNVNSYRSTVDRQPLTVINFPELLETIDKIPGDYWLRFVTSHPKNLSDELIKVMAQSRHLTPYLHLPVQSGDNEILKKMNRGYTVKYYKNLIRDIRDNICDISISTDIIVGFPGETKKQFENTVKLFKEVKFDMAYIAQYSERAGTAAAKLKDDVSKEEKKRREKILTEILKKTALAHNQKLIGKTINVLVEGYKDSFYLGKTATFKTVKFTGDKNLIGKFVKVKINRAEAFGLGGVFSEKMELKKSH